ncbi:MAG: histidinol-phosphate transaminase [Planctomycetaceae bacterium]
MEIVRPAIGSIGGYVPGEQPQTTGWIKLNTNENPYPASPMVAEAVAAACHRLEIYPDPSATSFREAAAEVYGLDPDWIMPANGSDENLTILMRTFVDPHETITYPYPGYILYETLAAIQGCKVDPMLYDGSWNLDRRAFAKAHEAKLALVPNPNSPSGTLIDETVFGDLAPDRGLLVLDGAYADFAEGQEPQNVLKDDFERRVVVTRTLSKSYSLAGLRFGFAIAHPDLIQSMLKVKDSYNCDSLAIAAATAAMKDQAWMLSNRERIVATRSRAEQALSDLGFAVTPSQANFLWIRHVAIPHQEIYQQLKARKILIRYMKFPLVSWGDSEFDGLRVSIGTDDQIDALLMALKEIL